MLLGYGFAWRESLLAAAAARPVLLVTGVTCHGLLLSDAVVPNQQEGVRLELLFQHNRVAGVSFPALR